MCLYECPSKCLWRDLFSGGFPALSFLCCWFPWPSCEEEEEGDFKVLPSGQNVELLQNVPERERFQDFFSKCLFARVQAKSGLVRHGAVTSAL